MWIIAVQRETNKVRVVLNRLVRIISPIQHNNRQVLTTVRRQKRKKNRRLSRFLLYLSCRRKDDTMRWRDECRLSNDEKYVLFFLFSSAFDRKILSILLVSCFCSSLSTSPPARSFFFGSLFFFPRFPLFRLSDSNDNKNRHSKRYRMREIRGRMKGKKNMSRTLTWQHLFAINWSMAQSYWQHSSESLTNVEHLSTSKKKRN